MQCLRPLGLLFCCTLLAQSAFAGNTTDRIIVKFKPATPSSPGMAHAKRADTVRQATGAAMVGLRELSNGAQLYQLPSPVDTTTAQQLASQIAADPNVAYAEPDRIHKRALVPNDFYYRNQWQLYDSFGGRLTGAWDVTTGSSSIIIAIVDTGYLLHEDLPGRFLAGYDFISDSFIANDGNARDADARDPGDWVTQADVNTRPECTQPDIGNSSWHGLLVGGIAGATGNNGMGIAGMSWGARLLPIRVLGKCGGYTSDIVDGMRWAAGLAVPGVPANPTPAHIINISLGSAAACSNTEQEAINAITSLGKVIVAATGNENGNAADHSPSNCAGVIAVGATSRSGSRAIYSNYGPGVTISAPVGQANSGEETYSTWNSGTTTPAADIYATGVGTSFAAPYVSGIISLMLSVSPALNPDQIRSIIQSTAQPFPSGSTCTTEICGAGIIDANAAVRSAAATAGLPPTQLVPSTPSGSTSSGTSSGGGGGGGGGCTLASDGKRSIDPTLLALMGFALFGLARRASKIL